MTRIRRRTNDVAPKRPAGPRRQWGSDRRAPLPAVAAALQEYPDLQLVVLIDDPPEPRYAGPAAMLAASEYDLAAHWLAQQADGYEVVDHSDSSWSTRCCGPSAPT